MPHVNVYLVIVPSLEVGALSSDNLSVKHIETVPAGEIRIDVNIATDINPTKVNKTC